MRTIILLCSIVLGSSLYSQHKDSDYFSIDGNKYLKPVKYVLFNPKVDEKKSSNGDNVYFYIKGEQFKFSPEKHATKTCSVKYLSKIKFSDSNELSKDEYEFSQRKVKEIANWKSKMLHIVPITRSHLYFKVFIIEKKVDKIVKYEVDWEYYSNPFYIVD